MADIRKIRGRIKGVENIGRITRAMEMIAASKMRKAQDRGLAGRPYSEKIEQVIADLAALPETSLAHPLLEWREAEKITIIMVTPDRGLCGGLNANLNRELSSYVLGVPNKTVEVVAVGKKGRDFARRSGLNMVAEFTGLGDAPAFLDTLPISHIAIDDYTTGKTDRVVVCYAQFISTLNQKPLMKQLLPVEPATMSAGANLEYIYEPNAGEVLGTLLPRFVEMEIYHAILEAIASEQSARMVAMRNAEESAAELLDELRLLYNKARQEAITTELLDITGGVSALEG
jgi:F-type H+-transporting ATPase subunit gamma